VLRGVLVVAAMVAALVGGLASASEAAGPPAGCVLTPVHGSSLLPEVYYAPPAGGHQVGAYAPYMTCAPRGTYSIRTTWMLQRYYYTGNLWKTEWTGQVRNYAGSPLNTFLPCVTSGALERLTVQFTLWSTAKKVWVYTSPIYVGSVRAICS